MTVSNKPQASLKTITAVEPYADQAALWPQKGQHILAHYDEETITVYQAFKPSIAEYAVQNQQLGGEFKFSRMSWIKPNFCWMQYRSGWNTKYHQERTLAIRIPRHAFDTILKCAAHSTRFAGQEVRKKEDVQVRLQWDPDHLPTLPPTRAQQRRAIQLGLRDDILRKFATEWIVSIEDITDFVVEMRTRIEQGDTANLWTPSERVYVPADETIWQHIGLSS